MLKWVEEKLTDVKELDVVVVELVFEDVLLLVVVLDEDVVDVVEDDVVSVDELEALVDEVVTRGCADASCSAGCTCCGCAD